MPEQKTEGLSLYQTRFCPFCVITRRVIERLNLNIEYLDTSDPEHRSALLKGGGMTQVPCLRIDDQGQTKWLYESADIIHYLNQQFG